MQSTNNVYQNFYMPKTTTEIFVEDLDKIRCYAIKNNIDVSTMIHRMISLYEKQDRNANDFYKFYSGGIQNF